MGLLLIAMAIAGCSSVKQEFYGHDPGHVWSAMQTVARNPEYRDWHVIENHVHVDGEEARINVYRILERSYVRPGSRPWDEQLDWRFHIVMEKVDPPTARFHTRGVAIPTRARDEGRRFFAAVRQLLYAGDVILDAQPLRPAAPAPEPQPAADEQPSAADAPTPDDEAIEDLGDLLEP